MTFHERVVAILSRHRQAGKWTDEAVAHDVLGELKIDHAADAPPSVAYPEPVIFADVEAERVAELTRHRESLAALDAKVQASVDTAGKAIAAENARHEAELAKIALEATTPLTPSGGDVLSRQLTEMRAVADAEAEQHV